MNNTPIRCVVFGFGHIGRRHVSILMTHKSLELVAIADLRPSLKDLDVYPDGIPFFTSASDLLQSEVQADAAIIALPNGLHTDIAIQCLQKGWHVLIEKPMGLRAADCQAVLDMSARMNKQVFVVKQNRYSPQVKWLKDLVSSGKLGQISVLQINCYWNRDDRYYKQEGNTWRGTADLDGGVLFTQFSHFIDILYWIFGEVRVLHASMANRTHAETTPFPDSGSVQFLLSDGGLGSLQFTTSVWDRNLESSITVIGEKGSVKLGGQYMDSVNFCHVENYEMPDLAPANPPNDYGGYSGSAANHFYVLDNMVNTLRGTGQAATNGQEGLVVVRIIEEMIQAAVEK
jgi:predicted dehydrogenase